MEDLTSKSKNALQNALNYSGFENIKVFEKLTHDKRKTKPKFFLQIQNNSISPVLDYKELNIFILGMSKAKKLLNQ